MSWLSDAILYEIYPQSFADSDGDGIGDLRGVLDHLDHLLSPGVGLGAAPTFERIVVDETFVDEELAEACGVDLTVHLEGEIITRTFSGEQTGPAVVRTINLAATATADGNIFRFRDVGADVVRIEPDGTQVLLISGQVPFFFAGALIVDLETGDLILEPQDRSEEQIARACAFLTGG